MSFNDLRLNLPQAISPLSGEQEHRMSIHLVDTLCTDTLCVESSIPRELLYTLNRCEADNNTREQLSTKTIELFISSKTLIKNTLTPDHYSQLVTEISNACKWLLNDNDSVPADQIANLYHRTIYMIGEEIEQYYEQYTPEPRHLWGEIHRLFEHAQLHRFDHYIDEVLGCSLINTYKRLVLLAIAGPYQFSQQESEDLNLWLNSYAELTEFSHQIGQNIHPEYYYIDLTRDASILSYQQVESKGLTEFSILAVNPLPVYQQLKKDLKLIRQGNMAQIKGLSDQDPISCFLLLKKALAIWSKSTSRKTERIPCQKTAEVVFGLHNIHGKLRHKYNNNLTKQGTVTNDSLQGACIQLPLTEASNISVGDLINYELNENDNRYRYLAIVRWVQRQSNQFILGIEFINGKVQPVSVKSGDQQIEAILVSFASEDSLVTDSGVYRNGSIVKVKLPNQSFTLNAYSGPLISRHSGVDHFKIRRASAYQQPIAAAASG
ncbi:PilZ domain-containing protein [Gynuella sp.]|uniref:PilZ domain-containing protein n=1 Tax=Gynuella sp. TaxID=2969146 RepID=UPI003D1453ED